MRRSGLAGLLGLVMLLVGCGPVMPTEGEGATPTAFPIDVTVTLAVFSGRPDPSWSLTPEQGQELIARIDALPEGEPVAGSEGLGYRGYRVQATSLVWQTDRVFSLYHGIVREDTLPNQPVWRVDESGELERWLLKSGESTMGPDLTASLERLLGPQADFAIYLIEGKDAGGRPILASTPLLRVQEVQSYERASHTLTLTPAAYARLSRLEVPLSGLPFAVCVGSEVIYTGEFWSMLSSAFYGGVTIAVPLDPNSSVIRLGWGYPGEQSSQGSDPRDDERIMQALARAGLLK